MNKLLIAFLLLFIIIINLSFVNSKFVCGFVNNSEEYSSSWMDVLIYAEEKPYAILNCNINPENKFCCDLDEITSVTFNPGKKVFAEVFDEETGFVAGPVSLILTDEGYDIFPEMILEKAINISYPIDRIFINETSIIINGSLIQNYSNLKYKINSSLGFYEEQVCVNCTSFSFLVPIGKGENELTLLAYGNREISEKIVFYNLDYLNFKLDVLCDKCRIKGKYIYVPSKSEVKFSSSLESSHAISGDFLFYFPSEWNTTNSLISEDFSNTHKILVEKIDKEYHLLINYTLQSPNSLIKRVYPFYQEFGNKQEINNILVFKSNLVPFHFSKHFENNYFTGFLSKKASPNQPILLNSAEDSIKFIAIFPKLEISKSYSNLEINKIKNGRKKEYSFNILTSLPEKDIEKILIVFKVENGKSIEVYNSKGKINLELYEKVANYTYYSTFIYEKGPFHIKIF